MFIELINTFLKARMLMFYGLTRWRKPEYPEKTTDFGRPLSCRIPTPGFNPEDTGIRSRSPAVTSECWRSGFTVVSVYNKLIEFYLKYETLLMKSVSGLLVTSRVGQAVTQIN